MSLRAELCYLYVGVMSRPIKSLTQCETWVLLSKRILLPLPEFHHAHVVSAANEECDLERKCLDEV